MYGLTFGVRHLLAAHRFRDAAAFTVDLEAQLARRRVADAQDVDRWVADCAAVARRAPTRDTRCWAEFARTSRHLFRMADWEPWRVLFQAAMDHADDSPVTVAAEAYEASGRRTWSWLRWLNG
jgi:hypothetical protein